ncbi:transposase [Flagellimonas algicola]|uniref:Transposase n=1 Tax=Flagellimonas algicola TaxID=2583815 RepID=A0ABY2WHA3_9FLAO|nr:transposase [Allomuricauda algicola]TMU50682.1 transposase [Allomuricauda algicola]
MALPFLGALVREPYRLVLVTPSVIWVDKGRESTSSNFQLWCSPNDIEIKCIQLGKPVQNSLVGRFDRSSRQKVPNAYPPKSLLQVRVLT